MLLDKKYNKKTKNKKEKYSRQATNSPQTYPLSSPMDNGNNNRAGASVHASLRGSLTVETAFVLPLFLLGMVMLLGIMDAVRVQLEENMKLGEKAQQLSMYAYAATSVYEADMVNLCRTYTYRLPVTLFPAPGLRLALRGRVHAWTGYGGEEDTGGTDASSEMVYITVNEGVYHTSASCSHLDLSISKTDAGQLDGLRNEYGEKYHSCEHCHSGSISGAVYITDKGNRYHASLSCSGLKRTVKLVKKDSVAGLHLCTRCQGGSS